MFTLRLGTEGESREIFAYQFAEERNWFSYHAAVRCCRFLHFQYISNGRQHI